jgi:hypothetical protein
MPNIKLTYKCVNQIFQDKGCILKSETYINCAEKLEYVALCGHINNISLSNFRIGGGLNCPSCVVENRKTQQKFTINQVDKIFTDKGCILKSETYINCVEKLEYVALCGHINNISISNFKSGVGLNCPSCVIENNRTQQKLLYDKNNNYMDQEHNGIMYFIKLVDNYFNVKKTYDGCKSDIMLKPNDITNDEWLGIQVKTTKQIGNREKYKFDLGKGKYDNCIILCICVQDFKMWLIPYKEIKELKCISIATKTKISKYNKYEINLKNITEKINEYYNTQIKFTKDILNTPIGDTQKQELHFKKCREQKIDFIVFKNNDREGRVYDFMIENKKVQEKVGTIRHKNINSNDFHLSKNGGRLNGKNTHMCYEKEDNHLYWLHCKSTNKFYVIPREILIENGYIGKKCKQTLSVSMTNKKTKWCNEYIFDYNNIDKEKLLQIINNCN